MEQKSVLQTCDPGAAKRVGVRGGILLAAAMLGLVAACTQGFHSPSGGTTIDESFALTGYRWQGGATVFIFAKAREKEGKTEVCAAWASDKLAALSASFNDQALAIARLETEDGDTLVHGMRFMNRLSNPRDVVDKPANCVLTDRAWKASYGGSELRVRTGRARFID